MSFASSEAPVASWMFATACLVCAGLAFGYDTLLASIVGAVSLVVAVAVGIAAIIEGGRNAGLWAGIARRVRRAQPVR